MLRIGFTSCCKFREVGRHNAWSVLVTEQPRPDWLLLLGDNVYSTWWRQRMLAAGGTTPRAALAPEYDRLFREPGFLELVRPARGTAIPFLATWDDHDFGGDDLNGAEPPHSAYRQETRAVFLEYLAGAVQPREEVYCSLALSSDVRVIMVDARYYRTSAESSAATLLGRTQEEWLLEELGRAERLKLLGSGSCLGFDTGKQYEQGWNLYGSWFETFRNAVRRHHAEGKRLLMVTGDLHRNRFVNHQLSGAGIPVLEAISSGAGRRHHKLIPWSTPLRNYGLLDVDATGLEIRLKGSLPRDCLTVRVDLDSWSPSAG